MQILIYCFKLLYLAAGVLACFEFCFFLYQQFLESRNLLTEDARLLTRRYKFVHRALPLRLSGRRLLLLLA